MIVTAEVETIMAKGRALKRRRGRLGRPPKDLAGDVKARILDAAERLFLKNGFQSASIDEIAELAPASKPTIYAHFPGKEALFGAVVARLTKGLAEFDGYEAKGRTLQDKLIALGTEIAEKTIKDLVGVARAVIAEADRLPELSRHLYDATRDRALTAVSQVLSDAAHKLPDAPKRLFATKRSAATAQIFMDLILLPMLIRSLLGYETKALEKELPSFVRERVNFFLAACGRLDADPREIHQRGA
jgi:AcrR family transcriptional regulator